MSVFRRCGLVMLAGVLLVGTAACSDSRQRNAANVGGTWACDNGQIGLLYQVAKNDGDTKIYSYVKQGEDSWGNQTQGRNHWPLIRDCLECFDVDPTGRHVRSPFTRWRQLEF